jgi:hypothetical protein
MEMYEYERLRNEHVLRKAQELRKILESSGTSDSVVNERIIAQSCSSIIQDKIADRASGRPTGRRSSKPSTTAVRRSERNIAKDPVEYREEGEDEPHRRSQEYDDQGMPSSTGNRGSRRFRFRSAVHEIGMEDFKETCCVWTPKSPSGVCNSSGECRGLLRCRTYRREGDNGGLNFCTCYEIVLSLWGEYDL